MSTQHAVSSSTHRFMKPPTDDDILKVQASSVPKTTEKSTAWSIGIWKEWNKNRKFLNAEFNSRNFASSTSVEKLNYWFCKFISEVCRLDCNEYPLNSLYLLSCDILGHVRKYVPELNFFTFHSAKVLLIQAST